MHLHVEIVIHEIVISHTIKQMSLGNIKFYNCAFIKLIIIKYVKNETPSGSQTNILINRLVSGVYMYIAYYMYNCTCRMIDMCKHVFRM